MCVNAVDLRNFKVKRLGIGLHNKADARKLDLALLQHVIHIADGGIETVAERVLEIRDQPCAAARRVIGDGGFGAVGGDLRQEGRARRVIGDKLRLHRDTLALEEIRQLADVVKKARQLDHHAAVILRQHEDLVVDEVAGLIGVKGHAVFSIDVHAALVQRYGTVSSLVHGKYLQNNFSLERLYFSFVGLIIAP